MRSVADTAYRLFALQNFPSILLLTAVIVEIEAR
jgi:hypothetical protein